MESIDWNLEERETAPELQSFGENQVGSVTLTQEPVSSGSPLSWVAEQFHAQADLFALPIEHDGGVVGLVTRARILERSGKFLENLSSKSLDQDLAPHGSLDARESVDKVVAQLFADEKSSLTELFLVYLDGQYFGVTDLRRLVSRSARMREHDLAKARQVQENSLSKDRLPRTSWQHARLVRMAYGVGGDFYQELSWKDGTCLLGCFDVSGKGVSGSLVTSSLAGFFSAVRSENSAAPELGAFSNRLNDFLRDILPLGTFVTGVLFSLPAQSTAATPVRVLNFGYAPVYYFSRKEGKIAGKGIKPNRPPLGLDALPSAEGAAFLIPLEAGTKIYVFSDGLEDLLNPSGKRFGDEQVRELIAKNYRLDAASFVAQLEAEIAAWQGEAPQADDITALTIQG